MTTKRKRKRRVNKGGSKEEARDEMKGRRRAEQRRRVSLIQRNHQTKPDQAVSCGLSCPTRPGCDYWRSLTENRSDQEADPAILRDGGKAEDAIKELGMARNHRLMSELRSQRTTKQQLWMQGWREDWASSQLPTLQGPSTSRNFLMRFDELRAQHAVPVVSMQGRRDTSDQI